MSSKPKVLMVASLGEPPYVGGIENVVDTLLRSKLRESFELEVFDTYRAPDPGRTRLAKASYAVRLTHAFRARVRAAKPDVVHIHFCSKVDFWKSAICLRVARSCGVKTIYHLHGGLFADFFEAMSRAQKVLTKRIFRMPDRVIALSSYWKAVLSEIAPPKRIRILNNPIDCERLSKGERSPNPDLPTVLLLGRVGKAKGHYDVLRALPLVVAKHRNLKVLFAGNEDEDGAMDTLKTLTEEAGLAAHVEFLGPVSFDPKVELLRTSTMMILPSHAENMPMSVLEGMAAGMPVISSTTSGRKC